MERDEAIGLAREQVDVGHHIEAMNILMEAWHVAPGDHALRLEMARVARDIKSLRHRQVLYQEIGGGEARFGKEIDERFLILGRHSESPGVALYYAHDEKEEENVLLWFLEPLWRGSELRQGWVLDMLAKLHSYDHPFAAKMKNFGAPTDDEAYATFPILPGRFVSRILGEEGPMSPAAAGRVMVKVLDGLSAAHELGLFHGNLRPDHLLVGEDHVKVIDLGLYALIRSLFKARKMTRTGQIPGLLPYLPPEFERDEPPDAAWDVCAAGAVAYEMLAGTPPYGAPDAPRLVRSFVMRMKEEEPRRPREVEGAEDLPEWVDEILLKMLARDPAARYSSAAEARDAWAAAVGP